MVRSGALLAKIGRVKVGCDIDCTPPPFCCAGLGFRRQKIIGDDGSIAFLVAGGTIVYRQLNKGEKVTVDSRSVIAVEESVQMGMIFNGSIGACCFGGEGCFSTTATGPGRIYMQSSSFTKFSQAVQQTVIDDRGSSNFKSFAD